MRNQLLLIRNKRKSTCINQSESNFNFLQKYLSKKHKNSLKKENDNDDAHKNDAKFFSYIQLCFIQSCFIISFGNLVSVFPVHFEILCLFSSVLE